EYHWRPALGNKGFLSVLRDLGGGEQYRSAVELEHFELGGDLERYFGISDQLPTRVYLTVQPQPGPEGTEPLGLVAGMLLQPLPQGDMEAFAELGARLAREFEPTVRAHAAQGAGALLKALVDQPDLEVMSRYPVSFTCSCSKERVKRALMTLGQAELEDILAKEGKAEADCHFCTMHYVITGEEIRGLIGELGAATE
ncbi:MAG: Hsp33 family molecular chaperone HslO, partial [Cystobacter sp.]